MNTMRDILQAAQETDTPVRLYPMGFVDDECLTCAVLRVGGDFVTVDVDDGRKLHVKIEDIGAIEEAPELKATP